MADPDTTILFRFRVWLARRFGAYRYSGSISMSGARGVPQAKVRYADGQHSVPMAIGTAVSYAEMFNGVVVPVRSAETHG